MAVQRAYDVTKVAFDAESESRACDINFDQDRQNLTGELSHSTDVIHMKPYKVVVSNCNWILYTKLFWPGDTKGTFQRTSHAATWLPHTADFSRCSCNCLNIKRRVAVNINFYILWFDQTWN